MRRLSMPAPTINRLASYSIFFDFDNTIAPFDILDDIITRFSINDGWRKLEEEWKSGKIGSQTCLKGQLKSVRVTQEVLLNYLSTIRIGRYFHKVLSIFHKHNVRPIILSDSFHFVIANILRNNGIKGIGIRANSLNFKEDRVIPAFPYANKDCRRCAHCKTNNLLRENVKNRIKVYVGDGLSDVCPAEKADVVFAKDGLLKHCRERNIRCIPFKNFKKVYNYFREIYEDGQRA